MSVLTIYLYTYDKTEKVPKSLSLNWWGFDGNVYNIQRDSTNYKCTFALKDKLYTKLAFCFSHSHSTAGGLNYWTPQTDISAGFAYATDESLKHM